MAMNKNSAKAKSVVAEKYKTKMCRGWLANGHCPYEFKCMFAHGDHELRTKEMNLADGLTHDEAVRAHQWRLRAEATTRAAASSNKPAALDAPGYGSIAPPSKFATHAAPRGYAASSVPPATDAGYYTHRPYDYTVLPPARATGVVAPPTYHDYTMAGAVPTGCDCPDCAAVASAAASVASGNNSSFGGDEDCTCDECVAMRKSAACLPACTCADCVPAVRCEEYEYCPCEECTRAASSSRAESASADELWVAA